jgi:sensor histidine kinase regulating citrate/malate metabolism
MKPEFHWTTTGSKAGLKIVHLPTAFYLLMIIVFAVMITILVTGKVTEQEKRFQAKQVELEAIIRARDSANGPALKNAKESRDRP